VKTQDNTQIIAATEADIPEILNFIRQLAIYEKLEHEVVATEALLRESLFGERPYAEVLLFEENSKRVGFALFFHSFSTFLGQPGIYLEDLYILPEFRGRGYGKKLLAHLARIALDRKCGRLEWSVLDWNQPALDFYASLGAKPMSEWTVQRLSGEDLRTLAD
jgi:GNAT superfamily N-acetyltransferase